MLKQITEAPFAFEVLFHHIGYACLSISESLSFFELFGYAQEGSVFTDYTQGVKGCFINGAGPRIELLENLSGSETLTPWIEAGVKYYHLAYLVEDISSAIDWAKKNRGRVIVKPTPAVAFDNNLICFVMFRGGGLVEFIQHKVKDDGYVL